MKHIVVMAGRRQGGFSLVELMVSMVLGLILIAGAISIYLATKQSYVEVERVAALTENARFAEQILGDSLRHAGFFGEVTAENIEASASLSAIPVLDDCSGPGSDAFAQAYNLDQFIYARTATGSSIFGCIDDVVPNTDVLVIKRVLPQPYSDGPRDSFDPNNPAHRDGFIDTPLNDSKTYVMTNNVLGLLFDGNDTPPTITPGGAVPEGTAWEYQYEVFYVRDADIPQLSRKTLVRKGATMEVQAEGEDIAEGVENLRVLLGYDSNGDGEVDTYENTAQITSKNRWQDVESVEVFMLVRSASKDEQYTDVKTYQIPGGVVGPMNDKYHRLISHASVSLRNLKLVIRGDA